ncbi:uncharacterized protein FA14DRAFT_188307 [Meira miltonrushii]|uniref:Uncharacterized protein n=1 Tax=Meira miltonrushii TaxID=1280837 RepID=A0A316VKZ6_9BASI|nr:uncharacterized protein FA14DRAFT_188307 [Meira miltonrushii]PWN38299.1 hypothetical protein FA14DRAFT_188307 [Meira miltonrushii]
MVRMLNFWFASVASWSVLQCFALPMASFTDSIMPGTFLEEGSLPLPILDMIQMAEREGEVYFYDPTSRGSTSRPIRSILQT